MDAAEDLSLGFNAVSDNPALTMRANRRQRMDRALEAIEGVMLPANDHFKRLVIFVFANFACSHNINLSRAVSFAAVLIYSCEAKLCLFNAPTRRRGARYKAAQQRRTPKRGRPRQRTSGACVLKWRRRSAAFNGGRAELGLLPSTTVEMHRESDSLPRRRLWKYQND
jgi:hypothetical protein